MNKGITTKILLILQFLLLCSISSFAQDDKKVNENYEKQLELQQQQIQELQQQMQTLLNQTSKEKSQDVKPKEEDGVVYVNKGKVFARVFMDYTNNLRGTDYRRQGFDISRAYLGYDYQMTTTISARVMIDAAPEGIISQSGPDSSGKFGNPVLKNAYVKYDNNRLAVTFGMFTTLENGYYNKHWDRYIAKGFAVDSKLDKGTDIGVSGSYKFNNFVTLEGAIMKGEGFKKISKDGSFVYTIAAPLKLSEHFTFRPLFSIQTGENYHRKDRMFVSLFLNYKSKFIDASFEYLESFNEGESNLNKYGFSWIIRGKINNKFKPFARFDILKSNKSSSSYSGYDLLETADFFQGHTNTLNVGLEYSPIKNLKFAPTFSLKNYRKASADLKDINGKSLSLFVEFRI